MGRGEEDKRGGRGTNHSLFIILCQQHSCFRSVILQVCCSRWHYLKQGRKFPQISRGQCGHGGLSAVGEDLEIAAGWPGSSNLTLSYPSHFSLGKVRFGMFGMT